MSKYTSEMIYDKLAEVIQLKIKDGYTIKTYPSSYNKYETKVVLDKHLDNFVSGYRTIVRAFLLHEQSVPMYIIISSLYKKETSELINSHSWVFYQIDEDFYTDNLNELYDSEYKYEYHNTENIVHTEADWFNKYNCILC